MQKSKLAVILSMSMIGTICISNKAFGEEYAKHEGTTLEVLCRGTAILYH